MSAVFKTDLRPRFIGPFTVTAKKGLAYTLNLPRKLRTHPVFYVGLLKPYRDPSHVNLEAHVPTTRAVPRIAVSESASPTDLAPSLSMLHRLRATCHRIQHTLGLTQGLLETLHFKNQFLVVRHRYTGHPLRCSMSMGIVSFMSRDY